MLYKVVVFLLFSLFLIPLSKAQDYLFPVNPGEPCQLVGSVGEIRASHFHTGLDIAVNTGTKVQASADGYVYKIGVSTYGYGRVLYVKHPQTNQQTVYGHLNKYNDRIGNYVRQKQYEAQSFEIELFPKSDEFPVTKGEVIAETGNTGHSGGPHLHYEIRTLDDVTLNPMLFGFKELPNDDLPPLVKGLAIKALDIHGRVHQQFNRFEYKPTRKGNDYQINQVIPVYGKIGFEVLTHDVINNSYNTFGTTGITIYLDGKKTFSANLNKISHQYNRCMNVHVNYEKHLKTSEGYQKCYVEDGNWLPATYQFQGDKGKINIQDIKIHTVQIILSDPSQNKSVLTFKIKGEKPFTPKFIPDKMPVKEKITTEIHENTLVIAGHHLKAKGEYAKLYFNGIEVLVPLAYMSKKQCVYLWDLRNGLPDYVEINGVEKHLNFMRLIPSEKASIYQDENIKIHFPAKALFDTLFLESTQKENGLVLHQNTIPLFDYITISFRSKTPSFKEKTAMYYQGYAYQSGTWDNNFITFKTRSLGGFYLKKDFTPPTIRVFQASPLSISLGISDDLSGIATYKATLNGKFLLMNFEFKTGVLLAELLHPKEILKGDLVVEVVDNAGNKGFLRKSI
jgi:hypothetical protein